MKREILFRGKRIDNGEWAYGYYGKTQRKCTETFYYTDVEEVTE